MTGARTGARVDPDHHADDGRSHALAAATGALQVDCHGRTNHGRVRERNEDSFLVAELHTACAVADGSLSLEQGRRTPWGWLLAVADGMGGHPAGHVASEVALRAAARQVLAEAPGSVLLGEDPGEAPRAALAKVVQASHAAVREEARRDPARRGMGTTLTLAWVLWPRLYLAHVGDSRCYLWRDGALGRLTRDHTVAEEARRALGDAQLSAAVERYGSMLARALVDDGEAESEPDLAVLTLRRGDALLLCTDGLTQHLDDEALTRALSSPRPAAEVTAALVAEANAAGGKDNITSILARFP